MKKTLTINLGGTVFHIDEDAYSLLDSYLSNLHIHFRREEGADEILHDMELRISELFADRLGDGKQVITIEDVEEIIARMGKPEDIASDGEEESGYDTSGGYSSATAKKGPRRLFRDPDDKVLGGVASGFAAYFDGDVTWMRIAFLLLGIFVQGFIIAYIIAWIVIPLARTVPEKLAMRGAAIDVESIGRTVTDGFEKVNDYMHSDRPRSLLRTIGEGIVAVAGFLIKFLLVVIGVVCAPFLLVLLIICFGLLIAATGIVVAVPAVLYEALPQVDWDMIGAAPGTTIALAVSGILIIGVPIIGMIHLLMRHFGGWQPMSTATKVIFIVLWFVASAVAVLLALYSPFVATLASGLY